MELQHFGRVLTTPKFSIINVPFALLVDTRHKIGTVRKTKEKTVFQASFAWPNRRNNILLHAAQVFSQVPLLLQRVNIVKECLPSVLEPDK